MAKLPLLPTLGKTLKNSLTELYRSMGYTLITSLVWFVAFIPIVFVGIAAVSYLPTVIAETKQLGNAVTLLFFTSLLIGLFNGLLTGPVTTALYAIYQERKEGYPDLKLFFKGFIRYYWISARVHWAFSLIAAIFIFNVLLLTVEKSIVFLLAGIFSIYALFLLWLLAFFLHPLIYYQHGFTAVFKKAFLLTLDNLALIFCLSLLLTLMFALSLSLVFLIVLVYGAFYIYFVDNGFEFIYSKYEANDGTITKEEADK
jgi:uncharacterized membrane protein YesL